MTVAAPSGVVTLLFTDVEGSTRRWENDANAMRSALAAHDEVLRSAIEAHGGWLFKHTGDGVCAPFASPRVQSMRRWSPSVLWNFRSAWGSRPAKPNCARVITSVRCSIVRRG
jgi:class 3 adenylate cyclase